HPTSCPLVPYTTLFRSEVSCLILFITQESRQRFFDQVPQTSEQAGVTVVDPLAGDARSLEKSAALLDTRQVAAFDATVGAQFFLDRKSTRLNSSHVKIS